MDEIIEIARTMKSKSFSKELKGTVKEILGTALSIGCQVDGKSPRAITEAIENGEIDSTLFFLLPIGRLRRRGGKGKVPPLPLALRTRLNPPFMSPALFANLRK